MFEYTQGETDTIKDIRLYEGATLTITSKDIITLKSKNAQDLDMAVEANPLTEGVELASGETKTAGVDFAPGIYDVELTSGYGIVEVQIYGEGGQEWDYVGLDLEEGWNGWKFLPISGASGTGNHILQRRPLRDTDAKRKDRVNRLFQFYQ